MVPWWPERVNAVLSAYFSVSLQCTKRELCPSNSLIASSNISILSREKSFEGVYNRAGGSSDYYSHAEEGKMEPMEI